MVNNEVNAEKTEILFSYVNITGKILESIPRSGKIFDICYDAKAISYMLSNEAIMSAESDFVHRGGKMRIVTEITNDNIAACKEMIKIADLRHLEGRMNTFSVTEKEYFGHITQQSNGELTQAIHSNARRYVESQMYL